MKTMRHDAPTELTIHPRELRELFSEREFDPFADDPDALASIAQVARFPNVTSSLGKMRLRVLLPAAEVSPETQARVERAIARYCSHKIAEAYLQMAEWRHGALSTFLWGLAFFALSLLLTAGVQHADFLPDAIRTLAVETLVIAGWVIMWQPMDTLILGWLPIRQQERTFRAIGSMRAIVEAKA
ncbi:MAG TPA: hypothetical protein VKR56_13940 [Candidatus Cybelea sp.]|nr:hypothetical protein [Candidatus Cybelea sp.]